MAKIPSPTFVTPRFGGTMMPQGAYGDSTQAIASVVGAIGGAVGKVIDYGFEAQEIRNKTQVREKLRELRNMQAEFQNDVLKNNTDPAEWVGEWNARLASYEKGIMDKSLPPAVREALAGEYADYATSSVLQIGGAALKENRKRAREIYSLDINDAVEAGQPEKAIAAVKEAKESNVLNDHEAEVAIRGINKRAAKDDRELQIELDPTGYLESLEAGEFDDQFSALQKVKEIARVENIRAAKETDAVRTIKEMIEVGMIANTNELEAQVSSYPEIDHVTKQLLVKEMTSANPAEPLTYKERYDIADQLTDNFKRFKEGDLSLDEYTTMHNKMMTTLEVLGNRPGAGALRERAYRVDPSRYFNPDDGTEQDEETIRRKAQEQKDTGSVIDDLVRVRASGATNTALAKVTGEGVEEPMVGVDLANLKNQLNESEVLLRVRMERELNAWAAGLETPPNAEQIKTYMDTIQPRVAREVIQELRDAKMNPAKPKQAPKSVMNPYGFPEGESPGEVEARKAMEFLGGGQTPSQPQFGNPLLPPKPFND